LVRLRRVMRRRSAAAAGSGARESGLGFLNGGTELTDVARRECDAAIGQRVGDAEVELLVGDRTEDARERARPIGDLDREGLELLADREARALERLLRAGRVGGEEKEDPFPARRYD